VKVLPFSRGFQPETVNSKWSQGKDFCVLLNSRHGVALENSWGQFVSSLFIPVKCFFIF
jgi:hypothetical protein